MWCYDMILIGHVPAEQNKSLASEDVAFYRESSMYDSLLMSLKLGSKSLSDALHRRYRYLPFIITCLLSIYLRAFVLVTRKTKFMGRQRQEEGKSDSEEDEYGDVESDAQSHSEENDSDEGGIGSL